MLLDPYTWHTVRIRKIIHESPDAVSFRVDLPPDYRYVPGQHAIVKAHVPGSGMTMRQYSFSSSPLSNELWFTVVRTPSGAFSTWCVHGAAIGDKLEISQPFHGPLTPRPKTGQRICMIAGGSGIVPLMSHLRSLRLQDGTTDITLLYSTRSTSRCFTAALVAEPHETIIQRETDKANRFTDDELRAYTQGCNVAYVCGSREFVVAVRRAIAPVIPAEHIFSEAFSVA